VTALLLAFASSVAWGAGDFLGGLKSRRLPLLNVLVASQATGLVLVGAFVALRGEGPPGGELFLWAPLSGIAGAVGLAAFYRALAVGNMGVVAPISATAAVVPLVVGVVGGDRPAALQYVGIAMALAGVVLASRAEVSTPLGGRTARGAGLALLSALGFGLFFVGMDHASDSDVAWAILVNRTTSVAVLLAAFAVLRPPLAARKADLAPLAAIGMLDIGANAMFAIASTKGLVSLVSVAATLYPITTVTLAAVVLGERPHRVAQVGVVLALAGVALIAAGQG
jgi:drug/metabolite transporter (DMT)-like permease